MLTDEQKDAIGMALVPLYQQLERDVIADCARRLQKTGRLTETAEIMADALRAKGYSPTQIRREVMRAINADLSLQREIAQNTRAHKQAVREAVKRLNAEAEAQSEHLWEKAGGMAFRGDLSAWQGGAKPVKDSAFSDMIAAMRKAAAGELKNLTKSLGFRLMDGSLAGARSIYTAEMNRALVKLTSGAFSWRQCVRDACRELGRSGLRTVDYDSGAARSLDTAAFNALRTSSARLSAEITMHNVETTGTELVEVSSHWGAREGEGHANHAGWQGKIYSVHGATDKYPNLEEATGYPSDPRGLCGYNCRHTFYPYWEGISEPADFPAEPAPVEVNGRKYTYYQATQEQRRREREIRAMKREANALEAAGEGDAAKELRSAIRGKALEYRQFSDDVGIRAKVERLGVCEPLTGGGKSGIIKMRGDNVPTIRQPIEQRNTGKGSPNAMLHFDRPLNNRQMRLLEQLPVFDSRATVRKKDVNMRDLAALTAQTGDEYALFTRKGERLVVRGSAAMTNIDEQTAREMAAAGWRWSGHTHPGTDLFCLYSSEGDRLVLDAFGQETSVIYNSLGQWLTFENGKD